MIFNMTNKMISFILTFVYSYFKYSCTCTAKCRKRHLINLTKLIKNDEKRNPLRNASRLLDVVVCQGVRKNK